MEDALWSFLRDRDEERGALEEVEDGMERRSFSLPPSLEAAVVVVKAAVKGPILATLLRNCGGCRTQEGMHQPRPFLCPGNGRKVEIEIDRLAAEAARKENVPEVEGLGASGELSEDEDVEAATAEAAEDDFADSTAFAEEEEDAWPTDAGAGNSHCAFFILGNVPLVPVEGTDEAGGALPLLEL